MSVTNDTLESIKSAQDISKGFTQATGLVNYDLQAPALKIYPVITPLRNSIPRVSADGGTATHWKVITAINTGNVHAGISEGQRGGTTSVALADKTASYKGLGLEDYVTFEADYAAAQFDDAKARAVEGNLLGLMIQEERMILGGNASVDLGTTSTPVVAVVASGGTLSATQNVYCVALTMSGAFESSVSGGVKTTYTRTNADGSTDTISGFHAAKSAIATATISSGSANSITASVTAVAGAAAYAWYWGTTGNEVLGAITTINSTVITAAAAGTQNITAITVNSSTSSLDFDGLFSQIIASGSGAYIKKLGTGVAGVGTTLTADGAGGCNEVNDAFTSFWDNYRLSPEKIYVSASVLLKLNKIVIANGGAPLIRYAMDASGNNTISGGVVVTSLLNQVTNTTVQVEVHPDMPAGMMLFYSSKLPAQFYKYTNAGNLLQLKVRKEYYQTEWPLRTRKYEYGVYVDELLQNFFTPAFGLITNIA
jgi:hypothetical protein